MEGQLFETPLGKFLFVPKDVPVKNGKVEVSLEQMMALTGNRPLPPQGLEEREARLEEVKTDLEAGQSQVPDLKEGGAGSNTVLEDFWSGEYIEVADLKLEVDLQEERGLLKEQKAEDARAQDSNLQCQVRIMTIFALFLDI